MMLNKLTKNTTPKEFSLSGLDLGGARSGILARHVAFNKSLTQLDLSRKSIQDTEGMDLAKMLFSNKVLRSLHLEGNNLGPKSAKEFGIALRVNNTLRLLDLESNQLTQDGEDLAGIVQFINALQHNKSLISLNLANNKLEEPIDKEIRSMLEVNTTIIDFEFGFNSFRLPEVRKFLFNTMLRLARFRSCSGTTRLSTTLND